VKPKVHLVDATYELFRTYFGAPPKTAPDGRQVGAVRGLMMTLLYLLREEGATHVGCATDHVIRSFRNELWPGYKTEEGIAPDLWAQFPLAEEAMRALGFVVWPMVELEADDALAAATAKFTAEAEQVIICTVDKDLAQCVHDDHVIIRDRRRKIELDAAGVREKYGVDPLQIPDWLALVGDTSDGYPGIPGFGAKGAAALVRAFGSLEAVPLDAAKWPRDLRGAARLAVTFAEMRDAAYLFKRLATLRTDAPIPEALDELRWRGPRPELADFCKSLGAEDILDRLPAPRP
jgi:5'-3' exonuclease